MNGYAGKILRIDLSHSEIVHQEEDAGTLRAYLGGMSLGARLLYDGVSPGLDWSHPSNLLILTSGPLGGLVAGSGTFCVVTKGAMTNGATSTQANGFFGAFLRFNGYDAIVVSGKASRLSWLYIHDGQVEIRDAGFLTGQDTWQTEDSIKQEIGATPSSASVFSIGPAGENLVRFAAMVGDRGHVAAHNGPGAVMGAKNLKAIAISRGSGRVPMHNSSDLSELRKRMFDTVNAAGGWPAHFQVGTLWIMGRNAPLGRVPFKNYTTAVNPMTPEQLATFSPEHLRTKWDILHPHPCWGCRMHHCQSIRIPEGPLAGQEGEEPEYEGLAAMGPQLGIYDGITASALSNEIDRLGLDVNETGWVLGMAIEGYEKGLLTKSDTDGLEMTWGNTEAVRALVGKVARRQGFGEILAEGAMRAARHIGRGIPDMAIHSMYGNTPVSHDHRNSWTLLLAHCVANTGDSEYHLSPRASSVGCAEPPTGHSPAETATLVGRSHGVTPFIDSLGVCRQANREVPDILVAMVNAATGWDMTWEECLKVGLRGVNLMRAFNIRAGYTPSLERPSPRYGSPLPDGPGKGKTIMDHWEQMLEIYYHEMGWDRASGKPRQEILRGLGLETTARDLWPDKHKQGMT